MAVNTTQTRYFQNIGVGGDQLRFSQIASTMGLDGNTNVRWGDYRRKTGGDERFADVNASADAKAAATGIVPDAYENQTCGVDGGGISASTNHKVSSLRNMIKRYDVSYTGGSNSQVNIGAGGAIPSSTTWDENLNLNVPKRLTMDASTWKASTTSEHAVYFSDAALNLELKFEGSKLYGKEGSGGTSSGNPGGAGGSALYLRNNTSKSSSTGSTIYLNVSNNSFIAGGGGGGGGGYAGNTSGTTTCVTGSTNYGSSNSWNRSCPSSCPCNSNASSYFRGTPGYSQGTVYYSGWRWTCSNISYNYYGPPAARAGGNGGVGQGSNNIGGAGGGNPGQSAAYTNCPSGSQNSTAVANAGASGASGGAFGSAGGSASTNGGPGGKWLNASNTRWAHLGSSSNTILKGGTQ